MKTVTQLMRSPSFDDAVIYDDRTETTIVHRVHSDCEEIEMCGASQHEIAEHRDLILAVCG